MPAIEWSFNLGTIVVLIFATGGFYWVTKYDMRVLKDNVLAIKEDMKMLNKAVSDIAVQTTRLDNQEKMIVSIQATQAVNETRVWELSRAVAEGLRSRGALDGQWPK